jgi:hypothetical protein
MWQNYMEEILNNKKTKYLAKKEEEFNLFIN